MMDGARVRGRLAFERAAAFFKSAGFSAEISHENGKRNNERRCSDTMKLSRAPNLRLKSN